MGNCFRKTAKCAHASSTIVSGDSLLLYFFIIFLSFFLCLVMFVVLSCTDPGRRLLAHC